ncbi:MAG TPA: purine-nucleoside phosphorylase [Actinomycetota bacterium]|nr:purine-nucleoside phosphorylase [Actinomycetota bacterium]
MSGAIARATGVESHRAALVLGSGLSGLARSLTGGEPVPFGAIEGMPTSTVQGHEGAVYSGDVGGTRTLVFAGRVHLYEGRAPGEVVRPVELAIEAGCDTIVLTNAAGAIDDSLEIGAPCLVSDHLNLTGRNPLRGPHDGRGPRFLDLSETYDAELRARARAVDPALHEGVYAGLPGPTYETPAEVRMLAALGADLVGMSTVLEAIMARYLGARVLGISVVTNLAAGLGAEPLSHDEVADAGRRAAARLEALLRGVLGGLSR